MDSRKKLQKIKERRGRRARAKIFGAPARPRLSVFRSNRFTYAQLIDDEHKKTVAAASSRDVDPKEKKKGKTDSAHALGERIAKKAIAAGITKATFDRGEYRYHGRVKAVAEGARKGGLEI